jgi:hypothetical protein
MGLVWGRSSTCPYIHTHDRQEPGVPGPFARALVIISHPIAEFIGFLDSLARSSVCQIKEIFQTNDCSSNPLHESWVCLVK